MMITRRTYYLFSLLLLTAACKQAYTPPVISANQAYLVVEGFINNGPDSTYITVTHTFKLKDTASVTPELHARLTVEGKDKSSYPLTEWGKGQYGVPSLILNNTVQYRLHIKTAAGKEYLSDYVTLRSSPPIDSINWERTAGGVQIYSNTHDPQNATHYYRWDYMQVWEFHSYYYQQYQNLHDSFQIYSPNTHYTCWAHAPNTNILINSTDKLTRDVVYKFPLTLIPVNSWLISVRYSINVKQYALSPEAYNFWQDMQRNSEQIGSIFSPQPSSRSNGNVHAVSDSSEEVIGYISGGTLRQQRIFITPFDVPNWRPGSYEVCEVADFPLDTALLFTRDGGEVPVDSFRNDQNKLRWNITVYSCTDCRVAGITLKPPYW